MIALVIAWTCVGVFIATALLTLLALAKVIELADKKYLDRLFAVLVVEIVAIAVGVFAGAVELPGTVEKRCVAEGEKGGRKAAVEDLRPEIGRLQALVREKQAVLDRHLDRNALPAADKAILEKPVQLDDAVVRKALQTRSALRPVVR